MWILNLEFSGFWFLDSLLLFRPIVFIIILKIWKIDVCQEKYNFVGTINSIYHDYDWLFIIYQFLAHYRGSTSTFENNTWVSLVLPRMVFISSAETTSFYWDHRPLLSQPALPATSFLVCDHRKPSNRTLRLIRAESSEYPSTRQWLG